MQNRNFFEDVDPEETREWLEALESVLEQEGPERAGWLLETLTNEAQEQGVIRTHLDTPYLNTRGASRSELVEGIFSAAPPMLFGSLAYALLYSRTLVAPHHPRPDPRDRAAALMIWLQGWCESWS